MSKPDQSPEAVVRGVIAALEASDWSTVLPLVDPTDLPKWKRNTLQALAHMDARAAPAILAEWGVTAAEELGRCGIEDLFARWLRASAPDAKFRVAHGDGAASDGPALHRQVIGTVYEGEELAHVVYRDKWTGQDRSPGTLRIATVRRTPAGWRMRIDHGLLSHANWHLMPASPPPPR
jgi:hypothetical protein